MHHVQRNDAPDLIVCNAAAAKVIKTIRDVVYLEHCLLTTETKEGEATSVGAGRERNWRNVERSLYSDLSQRYECPTRSWSQPRLLSEGKHRVLRCTKQHSAYPLLRQCLRTSILSQRLSKLCQRPERRHRRRRRLLSLSRYLGARIILSLFFFFPPESYFLCFCFSNFHDG